MSPEEQKPISPDRQDTPQPAQVIHPSTIPSTLPGPEPQPQPQPEVTVSSSEPTPIISPEMASNPNIDATIPASKNRNLPIILAVTASLLILVGGVAFFAVNSMGSSDSSKEDKTTKPAQSDAVAAKDKQEPPAGYTQYTTDCYKINVPDKYQLTAAEDNPDEHSYCKYRVSGTNEIVIRQSDEMSGTSEQRVDETINANKESLCKYAKIKVDTDVFGYTADCPSSSDKATVFIVGANTKLGPYPKSSGDGAVTIGVEVSDVTAATALINDLYKNISAP